MEEEKDFDLEQPKKSKMVVNVIMWIVFILAAILWGATCSMFSPYSQADQSVHNVQKRRGE